MGSVFGKESVKEPPFEVLMERTHQHQVQTPYELRRYGERFAAEASYTGDDNTPFRLLASYIGVFGNPQNERAESISMTAPVMKSHSDAAKAVAIDMTAPVVKSTNDQGQQTMEFVLPAEYDDLSKIPKPTNPNVHIKEIPSQVGAVHRYSGSMDDKRSEQIALELAKQLRQDGLEDISDDHVIQNYQFWGYNPPFCLPPFRRNEIWIELTTEQAEKLVKEFNPEGLN